MLMFFSILLFSLASPFYVKLKAKSNLIVEMLQVDVASCRKQRIELSPESSNMYYHKDGSLILPSERLRFLNKACIIIDPEKDLTAEGRVTDLCSLCTVNQVKKLKKLLKVIPLWSTGMIMALNMIQNSFSVLQAKSMNRKFGSSFEIPAGFFSSDNNCRGKRGSLAIEEGFSDDPEAVVEMSAIWLIPQHRLIGFAESLNTVGQNEFSTILSFPKACQSIASTLCLLGISLANLVSSFLVSAIDNFTKRVGKY
ncbi:hypothetical protein ACH5RR_041195 [Cinchona calisaya]|uniref:Uncharacterized protein n=1 Tax=Cinchona calisaya TaxID=153742 RepID=A0ABD2XTR3_9GENT